MFITFPLLFYFLAFFCLFYIFAWFCCCGSRRHGHWRFLQAEVISKFVKIGFKAISWTACPFCRGLKNSIIFKNFSFHITYLVFSIYLTIVHKSLTISAILSIQAMQMCLSGTRIVLFKIMIHAKGMSKFMRNNLNIWYY